MSKPTMDEQEFDIEGIEDEIGDEDYGFVFDAEGNLKYAFVTEVTFNNDPPKIIKKIMKLLDVTDIEQFNNDITIH